MSKLVNDYMDALVDVGGMTPALSAYTFIRVAAPDVTMTGVFVGWAGEQVGAAVSYTISNTGVTLTSLYNAANSLTAGTPLPPYLVGFLGTTNGNVYYGFAGNPDGTIISGDTPAAGYPILVKSGDVLGLGRVPGGPWGGEAGTGAVQTVVQTVSPSAANSYSLDTSFGTAVNHKAKNGPGAVTAADATSINAAVRYLQIHNTVTALAGGETPLMSFPIPAGSSTAPARLTLDSSFFGANGYYLSTGVTWAFSTTQATYTAATAADHNINFLYQ